jgi:hypothetical protein
MSNYFFFIYSCKKNLKKANLLYDIIVNKLTDCTPYIIYGNTGIKSEYELVDGKYLVLNVGDNYENLTAKTLCLLHTTIKLNPYIKGIFKCDDDIIPNIYYLNNTMELLSRAKINYMGMSNKINNHMSICHYNKCSNPLIYNIPMYAPECTYATGPIYYLGIKSIQTLTTMQIKTFFSEDITIGYNLNASGILPMNIPLYKNQIDNIDRFNFQNIDGAKKTLMVRLHGGLGNQLFQAATGFYLAKKHSFILVLAYSPNLARTHGEEFSKTVFRRFNVIFSDNLEYFDNYIPLNEPNNDNTCFEYHGDFIINTYENYILTGYFINKEYVEKAGEGFVELLQNKDICNDLLKMYPDLTNSYFLHIRRGDYVGHKLYVIDYDTYFTEAIRHILSGDSNAHFYVVSDDIAFCKTYSVLNVLEKEKITFIENMDTLHSIYFMSLCKKGGICSNSTFSGWATILGRPMEDSSPKTIVFPKKWINTPHQVSIPFYHTASF